MKRNLRRLLATLGALTSVMLLTQCGDGDSVAGPGEPVGQGDVLVPQGFAASELTSGLSYATDITFSPQGEIYVSEAGGHTYGTTPEKAPPARILQIMPDGSKRVVFDRVVPMSVIKSTPFGQPVPAEGLIPPVNGVTWHDGQLYVAHRTRVSVLDPKTGSFRTIIDGMPSWGFFHNNKVIFGPDDKMYFVLSTQGNAGPIDEHWVKVINAFDKPDAREVPCESVTLTGENFGVPVDEHDTPEPVDKKLTGVYVPLGTKTEPGQTIPGKVPCNGAMLRANADGSGLEVFAWGLRSNFGYRFGPDGRLIATQNSGNPIAPREIYNDWEPIYDVRQGEWYGWPDYYSSMPVTDKRFAAPDYAQHKFVLNEETRRRLLKGRERPPEPLVRLTPNSAAEGFVFGRREFGLPDGEILVAQFGTVVIAKRDGLPGAAGQPEQRPGHRLRDQPLPATGVGFRRERSGAADPARMGTGWSAVPGGLRGDQSHPDRNGGETEHRENLEDHPHGLVSPTGGWRRPLVAEPDGSPDQS